MALRDKRTLIAVGATALATLGLLSALVLAKGGGGSGSLGAGLGPSRDAGIAPFSLTDLDGRRITVPRRGRPGLVFFTVSSCSSCIPSARALNRVARSHAGRIDVVLVDIYPQDEPANLRAWAATVGAVRYPLTIDRSGTLAGRYGVRALGTTVVYNRRGQLVERLIEPLDGELRSALRKAGAT